MSAAVEVSGFKAAFASRAVPAWHILGTVFDNERVVTTSDMLELAHLNGWNVRLVDVIVPGIGVDRWASMTQAIVRTNPFDGSDDVLAFVGDRYTVVQNETAFAFGDAILDGGGRWETAGSINDGRRVFGSLAMPNSIVLDPQGRADEIADYLLVVTSHDGSMPVTVLNTPVRVVCQNTLSVALKGAKMSHKIRHTASADWTLQAARESLAINVGYMDAFSKMASEMIQTEITKAQFDKIVEALYPAPAEDAAKSAKTRYVKRVDTLEGIYLGTGDGPDTNSTIAGTAWGAFNALTEALDWYRNPRRGDAESVLVAASGLDPVTVTEKARILSAVRALV
jgi:phage/plasmid-like protein (TIGR03299 family)